VLIQPTERDSRPSEPSLTSLSVLSRPSRPSRPVRPYANLSSRGRLLSSVSSVPGHLVRTPPGFAIAFPYHIETLSLRYSQFNIASFDCAAIQLLLSFFEKQASTATHFPLYISSHAPHSPQPIRLIIVLPSPGNTDLQLYAPTRRPTRFVGCTTYLSSQVPSKQGLADPEHTGHFGRGQEFALLVT
jgi:hypothetical protein